MVADVEGIPVKFSRDAVLCKLTNIFSTKGEVYMKKIGLVVTAFAVAGAIAFGVKKFNEENKEKHEKRLNVLARQLSNLHAQYNILKSSLDNIQSSDELDESFLEDRKEQLDDIAAEYASLYPEFSYLYGVHSDGSPRQVFETPAWMSGIAIRPTLD